MNADSQANLPIGIFDSGVGGLTVARAIRDLLPNESVTYVADTAHTPYGPRPIEEVRRLSLAVLDELVDDGVKMLVIACNTASTAVLRDAHERYDVPVVEVIGPTVRNAMSITRNGKVGLIGTETTVNSRVYDDYFSMNPKVGLFSKATPRFVELVEAGHTAGPEVERIASEYLDPLLAKDIDTLVLGCTHYPFLRGVLRRVVGPDVALVASDDETANEVYQQLADRQLLNREERSPRLVYEATGANTEHFQNLARRMLGIDIDEVNQLRTGAIDIGGL